MKEYRVSIVQDGDLEHEWTTGTYKSSIEPKIGDIVTVEHAINEFYTGRLAQIDEIDY